jgi:hypothetical protein
MTADPDEDEATTWAGDTDPSHIAAPVSKAAPVEMSPADKPKPATPSMLLITYGVLGGIFLIYTAGWFAAVTRLNSVRVSSGDVLTEIMFQLGEFLAIASPAIWFGAVFLLTRGVRPIVRLLWLLAGVVVVLPWPFVLGAWL